MIGELGLRILELPRVGVRVDGESTYDIAFVSSKAFAGFVTPAFQGRWTPRSPNTLVVPVLIPSTGLRDPHGFLQERSFGDEPWGDVYVGQGNATVDIAFGLVEQAYRATS